MKQVFSKNRFRQTLTTVIISLVSGLLGAYLVLSFSGNLPTSTTSQGNTKTSQVVYNNTTDTTKAAEKVQKAVVSVINYKKDTDSSLNRIYFIHG